MATVRMETDAISDWQSFHETCKVVFGFSDFYGMNMNAWIDCMSYLDEDAAMTRFDLATGEKLHIEIASTESFNKRLPEIFEALVECTASANQRYLDEGKDPVLSLLFL
jgi:RNAse (barnase) inhibitor barstar